MSIRKILLIVSLFGLVWLLGVVSPALACDPDTGDVADCGVKPLPTALNPTITPTPSPTTIVNPTIAPTLSPTTIVNPTIAPTLSPTTIVVNPTAIATLIATGAKSNGDSATGPANSPVLPPISFPLACLLPDGDNFSNALGVSDQCPAPPVQIRAVKVAPPPPPAPKPVVVPTPIQPKGDAPSSAKTITDALQTLDPGAVHWYKIDNGKNFYLDIYIDDNGATGITLAMYSPEQTNALSVDLSPKGRGGPVKNEPHDLLWKGSFATGVWYALVRNYNPTPVQYKIGFAQSTTERNCVSYWEPVLGKMTLWTDCGHYQDVQNFGK